MAHVNILIIHNVLSAGHPQDTTQHIYSVQQWQELARWLIVNGSYTAIRCKVFFILVFFILCVCSTFHISFHRSCGSSDPHLKNIFKHSYLVACWVYLHSCITYYHSLSCIPVLLKVVVGCCHLDMLT